jgi:hypothetical protein
MLEHMGRGDMPEERYLRTIASAPLSEQAEVWSKQKPKKGQTASWYAIANSLAKLGALLLQRTQQPDRDEREGPTTKSERRVSRQRRIYPEPVEALCRTLPLGRVAGITIFPPDPPNVPRRGPKRQSAAVTALLVQMLVKSIFVLTLVANISAIYGRRGLPQPRQMSGDQRSLWLEPVLDRRAAVDVEDTHGLAWDGHGYLRAQARLHVAPTHGD